MKNIWNKYTDLLGKTIFHPQFIMLNLTYQAIKEAKKYAKGRLLDIGCGRMMYRKEIEPLVEEYIGLDHPEISKNYKSQYRPEVLADAHNLPFKNNSFDTVLMLQSLEYMERPYRSIQEVSRILKKGGVFILSSPFLYPIHDGKYDRSRFTETQLRYFLETNRLKILHLESQGKFFDFWIQSLFVYLFKEIQGHLQSRSLIRKTLVVFQALILQPFMISANVLSVVVDRLKKKRNYLDTDFPLNYLVVARKTE